MEFYNAIILYLTYTGNYTKTMCSPVDENSQLSILLDMPGLIRSPVLEDLKSYFYPAPELSSMLITNCANNTNILLYKLTDILCPGLRIDRDFSYFAVDKDLYIADLNHAIYSASNPALSASKLIFLIDLLRIRYTEYQYMFKVLDSIIKCKRLDIDTGGKQTIIVNNFDLILGQHLPKFIEYIEKYHSTTTFILVGSGPNITHISARTKLSALCYIKRVYFEPIDKVWKLDSKLNSNVNQTANIALLSRLLYKLTAGDILKSWLVFSAYLEKLSGAKKLKTKPVLFKKLDLLHDVILPSLPVYNKIYNMLLDLIRPTQSLAGQMRNMYMVFAFPGMNITRFSCIICNLLWILGQQVNTGGKIDPAPGAFNICLESGALVKLASLSAKYSALEVNYIDEPVIVALEFMLAVQALLTGSSTK